jgi:hypothetical protein
VNNWTYKNEEFIDAAIKIEEGFIGFVYEITDISTNKKYIGKKLLVGKRKLPPLKGTKRKRTKIVESDWKTYHGSSELVQQLVEARPNDFKREILRFCKSKGELSYIEAKYQFDKNVLLSDDYHNSFVGCKIHAKHLSSLKQSYLQNGETLI